jgi:hypothetical protein
MAKLVDATLGGRGTDGKQEIRDSLRDPSSSSLRFHTLITTINNQILVPTSDPPKLYYCYRCA